MKGKLQFLMLISLMFFQMVTVSSVSHVSGESLPVITGKLPITVQVVFYDYNENELDLFDLKNSLPREFIIESQLPLDSTVFPIQFSYQDSVITGKIPVNWELSFATPVELTDFYTYLQSNASLGVQPGIYKPFHEGSQVIYGNVYDALRLESYFKELSPASTSSTYSIYMLNLTRFDTSRPYHWFRGELLNNDTSVDMRLGWSAGDHGLFFDPTATEWFSSYSSNRFTRLQEYLQDTSVSTTVSSALTNYFNNIISVLTKYSILQLPLYRIPYNTREFSYAHLHFSEAYFNSLDLSLGGYLYHVPELLSKLMPYTVQDGKIFRLFINQGVVTGVLFNMIQSYKDTENKRLVLSTSSLNQLRSQTISFMNANNPQHAYYPTIITVFDFILEEGWKVVMINNTNQYISPRSPIPFTGVMDLTAYNNENQHLSIADRKTHVQRVLQEYGSIYGLNLINTRYGWAGYLQDPMSTYDQDGSFIDMQYSRFNAEAIARYQALYWNITTRSNLYVLQQEMQKITNRVFSVDFQTTRTFLLKADALVKQGAIVESVKYYWDAWDALVNATKRFADNKTFLLNTISLSFLSLSIIMIVIILRDINVKDNSFIKKLQTRFIKKE